MAGRRGRRWTDGTGEQQEWASRPILAFLVRALARLLPVAVSVLAVVLISHHVRRPSGLGGSIAWWVGLSAVSVVVVALVDRLSRRLLPLAALLRLSLVFPDRTRSRLRTALQASSVRSLEGRLEDFKAGKLDRAPAQAATMILALAGSLSAHDRRTRGHSERVRAFTELLAQELHLTARDRDQLRWASLLHDIGKLKVPHKVLNKPGKPDEREWRQLQRHPIEGARLIEPLREWLGPWADAVRDHHEHFDGSGYPGGLVGEQISLGGRIVAVADAFETITATRPYKRPMAPEAARQELTRCAGSQFDPAVVRAFLAISVGRLRLAMGPLAWIGAIPMLGTISEVSARASLAGGQIISATAGTGAAATGVAVLSFTGMVGSAGATSSPPARTEAPSVEVDVAATAPPVEAEVIHPRAAVPTPPPVVEPPVTTTAPPPPAPPVPVAAAPAPPRPRATPMPAPVPAPAAPVPVAEAAPARPVPTPAAPAAGGDERETDDEDDNEGKRRKDKDRDRDDNSGKGSGDDEDDD